MSYYKTQMMVFDKIDQQIKTTIESRNTLKINQLMLDMSRIYAVSPQAIKKRIELYVEVNKDHLMIIDGEVMLR